MQQIESENASQQAEARIAAWQPGDVLDLAIPGLHNIPESIRSIDPTEIVLGVLREGDPIHSDVSDLTPIAGLTALKNLHLFSTQVSDLTPIAGLTALQSLDFSSTWVDDLTPIAGLTALQSLECSSTQFSDLTPIAGLTALQNLRFGGAQVIDLAPIASLTALQTLHFSLTQVSDLSPTASLTALQTLDCSGTRVNDLSPIAGLTGLQNFDCSGTRVSDLSPLANLTALQNLSCSVTHVSDLTPIAGFTALQRLNCSSTDICDLAPITGLTALQRLTYHNTKVSNLTPIAGLTALHSLTFSGTRVSDLTPIAGLTALQNLDCSDTKVSDLTPIAGLTALQNLDCSDTQVSDLTSIAGLTALQSLNCSNTPIYNLTPLANLNELQRLYCRSSLVCDLTPIAGLTDLLNLDCNSTRVSDLSPIAGLTALQNLACYNTQISDLTAIAKLCALQSLDFSRSEVSDLTPIAGLTALQTLYCSGTQISDLTPIAKLTALQSVYCDGTQVSDLTPLTGPTALQTLYCYRCKIEIWTSEVFERPSLSNIYATKLAGVPAEVVSQHLHDNCLPRLRAHLADLKGGAEPMRDGKMLVLGNGRVGKTQLVRTLFHEQFDESVASTHGITVRPLDLTGTPDGEPARLWTWDFGGQDIYHSTHMLFMKGRGIYLLAWTPACEDNDVHQVNGHRFRNHQLPYWLTQIGAFTGNDIPLIVVQTKADTLRDRAPLPDYAREPFDSFPRALEIQHSAQTGRGQSDLEEALQDACGRIEQPMVGKVRLSVKRAIEDMISAGKTRTMSVDDFVTLCDEHGGVAAPKLFLETLHNAGVVFHRPGYFADDIILDQQWAITAIYSVLERQSKAFKVIESMKGEFTRTLLGELLWDAEYTVKEQSLFLSMMQSCDICFARDRGIGAAETVFIAPDLLPEQGRPGWDGGDAAAMQIRQYAALPGALIRGVISAIGAQAQNEGDYWRSGLRVFEAENSGWVLIEAQPGEDHAGTLTIRTDGANAAALLSRMARIVSEQEARLGLSLTEVEGPVNAVPDAADDRDDEARGTYARPKTPTDDWFFSYARDDERASGSPGNVETFCDRMKTEQGITIRRDVDELSYGDAIEPFMQELSRGNRIYIWLTDAYLKSPYCMFELHAIWRACERDAEKMEDRIVVLLGDADIRSEVGQKKYRDDWDTELEAAFERLKRSPDTMEVGETLGRISGFVQVLSHLLTFIQSRIRYTGFEEMTEGELQNG